MRYEDEIALRFVVARHTKNCCDAVFGLVKRRMTQMNVYCSYEMMRIVESSSSFTCVVCATEVMWYNGKKVLGVFLVCLLPFNFFLTKCFGFHSLMMVMWTRRRCHLILHGVRINWLGEA